MEVIVDLGRYEFRAKIVTEREVREVRIPAEVYVSKNGLKFADSIQYNTLTEEKLKNVVTDPISILGRKFSNGRVLTQAANCKYTLVPSGRNQVQIKLWGISDAKEDYYLGLENITVLLLEHLIKVLQNRYLQGLKDVYSIKIQYPIKYTYAMLKAYEDVIVYTNLDAVPLSIGEILSLQDNHRGANILLLDIGYKFTTIYILHIDEELPFRHKIEDQHEFNYGGLQFDILLFNHFMTRMGKVTYTSLEQAVVMKLCDKVKKELSSSAQTTFMYENFSTGITRQDFERMIKPFVQEIFRKYWSMSQRYDVIYHFERGGCVLIPCIAKKLHKDKLDEDIDLEQNFETPPEISVSD